MSVVHDGRAPGNQYKILLRHLMIICPQTGRAADTGFELTAVPRLSARQQVLVDCLECGQDHEWQVEESSLE